MQTNNSRRADRIVPGVGMTVSKLAVKGWRSCQYRQSSHSLQRVSGTRVTQSFQRKVKIMLLNCSLTFTTDLCLCRRPGSRLGVMSSEQEPLALLLRDSAELEQPPVPGLHTPKVPRSVGHPPQPAANHGRPQIGCVKSCKRGIPSAGKSGCCYTGVVKKTTGGQLGSGGWESWLGI